MFFTVSNKLNGAGITPASFFVFAGMLFLPMIFSCSSGEEVKKGEKIATVYEYELYTNEIREAIPTGLSEEDSLEFVKNYTETWIRECVLLHHAEQKMEGNKEAIENRLEKYRRSLMIYELEKIWLEEELDTSITESEMKKYYEKNKNDFELKDYILKCVYIKLEKNTQGEEKALQWIKSEKKEDWIKLEEYSEQNAVSYYQDRDNWIFLNDILRDVPMEIPNKVSFLKGNKLVHFSDEEFTYILYILDYRLKEEISPYSMEKENIKSRILQSRMNELTRTMRNKLIKNAYNENEITISEK